MSRRRRQRPAPIHDDVPYVGDALAGIIIMLAIVGFGLIVLRNAMGVPL